jgi:hypothetical protein
MMPFKSNSSIYLKRLESGKALGIQYVLVGAAWLSLCSNVKAA